MPYARLVQVDLAEIPRLLGDYDRAARNAVAAGFDGVQVHAANGYLIDQFLRSGANRRTDASGGPVDKRVRLLREVAQTVADAANGPIQGVGDPESLPLFTAAPQVLDVARQATSISLV